ncbi:hypothetical protein GIB67_020242 [Kingdonia uniflora]|uniref:Raptor N-terminal CASPase-like domain-containing protein n=1 Tax=Kingdonia uniflora TaxID=39325 RepID=A0A7J7P400_9MAGN|nr:hypothetical protein GIB67_020242 [Kingdonia uniflora]
MALGDLMASRVSESSVSVSNHLDEINSRDEDGDCRRERDSEGASSSSVGTNVASTSSTTMTSVSYLHSKIVLCEFRHVAFEACNVSGPADTGLISKWRPRDRMKTGCVALVLCLNISVDPPDVIKISPCARMECWIDPFSMIAQKALDSIGKSLLAQYERWQPKARYKLELDPTVDGVKKLCLACRKHAKSERVLFHYNGHGVPKPTANGEIWLFNKSYTQYIPLPISDLDSWLKTPSIYVFDCSAAGMIVNAFIERQDWGSSNSSMKDCILLAACEAHETLPQSAEFPADVFTSCLTTPIKMALKWIKIYPFLCPECKLHPSFLQKIGDSRSLGPQRLVQTQSVTSNNNSSRPEASADTKTPAAALLRFCTRSLLRDTLDHSLIDSIPGRPNDRKTLLGELNWIFTAVTDTIAWNVLPHDLFQRLFRQDLLVASLFRNFLLAERIMRSANCSPISYPMLPSTHQHHMWDAWDMAAEICLSQIHELVEQPNAEFQSSPFFTEQLTAFEVWLDHGSEHKKPPEQLPIVLQVLLSQCHRHRALVLLGRFLDMGPWAVDLALSVGIFPYVLKLLATTSPELKPILVFIWTKILALDKSCQVDLVKDGGHMYFIRFLDSMDSYSEQRSMAAFVLAVIVDGHRRGQEACIKSDLIRVCLKHLQLASPHDAQTDPMVLQWLCLCLGKLWEDFPEAQIIGLREDVPAVLAPLLSETPPEVRASAVFALGTLLDVGSQSFGDAAGGDEDYDDDEKLKGELDIVKSLSSIVSDGSPLVRAEVAVALARFAFGHNKHLKSIAAAAYWKPSNALLSSIPSLTNISSPASVYSNPSQYIPTGTTMPSPIGPVLRIGSDMGRDGRVSASSPLAASSIMHGSPLSDDSSLHSDSGVSLNESATNGVINNYSNRRRSSESGMYSHCVLAMCTLAKDPSPRIAALGRRILSIIGIEQVATRLRFSGGGNIRQGDLSATAPGSNFANIAGLARSSSWLDMKGGGGHLPLTFRTPPVSPPRQSYLTGMRRVCSLEFRPQVLNSPDSGLADPVLGVAVSSGISERSLLPQSTIYNWSCGHYSRPLLGATDDNEETLSKRGEREKIALDRIAKCQHSPVSKFSNQIASWDTRFETGTKAALLQPFSPIVIAADDSERIRIWNYEEASLLNSFDNHNFLEKGISKLCLVNELDDSLLLVASCDGNVRIWKDYTVRDQQKLVTAFSSIQGHRPGVRSVNAVVDWQQQSGYLYSSGEISSIMVWDLEKEQLVNCIPSSSDSSISALSASQVHASQIAAGYVDGSVRVFDIRTPELVVFTTHAHTQNVERVVGLCFQPGLDQSKMVSASHAGDIQLLDIRGPEKTYKSIYAHRGSLTTLAVHRHAPVIASGSAKQLIKLFSLQGDLLCSIKYTPTFMAQKIGPVNCLTFHPYRLLLAAGSADSLVSIYADETSQTR